MEQTSPQVRLQVPLSIQRLDILPTNKSDRTTSPVTAFVLRKFLSLEECQKYIQQAEETGLEPCGYDPSIRRTDRVELKSDDLASLLFERARPHLTASIVLKKSYEVVGCEFKDWPVGIPRSVPKGEWIPSRVNQPLRICRYQPGGFFLPHHDGAVIRSDRERSLQTLMVYLNDGYQGGATNFYTTRQRLYAPGELAHRDAVYQPQAGDALIFFSAITHDGGALLEGQKYILRSEIMYKRVLTEADKVVDLACKPDHDSEFDFIPGEDGGFDYPSDDEGEEPGWCGS